MNFKLAEIAEIVEGKTIGASTDLPIFYFSTDSRAIISGENTLFFALVTNKNDGHRFIQSAIDKGVRAFVVSTLPKDIEQPELFTFIKVADTLKALQTLAIHMRDKFHGNVIGITGSNGKTIVKEWLSELISPQISTIRSPKSFNSQIGVPLSVSMASPSHKIAIWEAGISQCGEMERLEPIIKPQIGIFTNIGEAHQANFKSLEEKINEKMKLFTNAKTLIVCQDHQNIWNAALELSRNKNVKLFSWSKQNSKADLYIETIEITPEGTGIVARNGEKWYAFSIPFSDYASIEDACHCLATLVYLGIDDDSVLARFSQLQPVAMRLEIKEAINNSLLINDSYNTDINSLGIAINTLNQQASKGLLSKTLIISDIFQSSESNDQLYQKVAQQVEQSEITHFIGVGPNIGQYKSMFPANSQFFNTTEQLLSQLESIKFSSEAILLKGARDFHFDQVAAVLQAKVHETVLEIDMSAMVYNLNYFRSKLKKNTKMTIMVKAFSYGTGMAEVARLLEYHHVDCLAVAIADEGVSLRKAGIKMPIMVMNPEDDSFDLMIEYNLEPNIYSASVLTKFIRAAKRSAVVGFPIHIKVDTGMKRLGFETCDDMKNVAEILSQNPELHIKSVFSHLVGSDEAMHDDFSHSQIEKFQKLSSALIEACQYPIDRHILNSAGIERFPEFQFEMVRLGIGLYGISALGDDKLMNVSSLKTTISQIRSIKKGESIGYGRKSYAERDLKIAVIPIGYADGMNRHLSNGVGTVWVNGDIAHIIGNICMDMCMIDVTDCKAKEGDHVVVFGKEHSPMIMANALGTIPYEVFTSISQRVKRIYFQE